MTKLIKIAFIVAALAAPAAVATANAQNFSGQYNYQPDPAEQTNGASGA